MNTYVGMPSAPQPWLLMLYAIIVFILSVIIGMCKKQMDVMNIQKLEYEQQMDKKQMEYENQIAMYKEKMEKEKLQCRREIAECEHQIVIMDQEQIEYKNQIAMYKERIRKEKLEYRKEIAECEQQMDQEQEIYETRAVIRQQIYLISRFKFAKCDWQLQIDQFITKLKRLCELKDMWSLSEQEENELSILESNLQLNVEVWDFNGIAQILRKFCVKILENLSTDVEKLEYALHEMDIEKMRELQNDMNTNFNTYFQKWMESVKEEISSSKELKGKGILYQLYELFMPKITHIAMEVAINIFKHMIV